MLSKLAKCIRNMRLCISSSLWQGLPFTLYLCGCFFIAKMLKILFCNVSGFFMKKNCFILSVFFFLPIIMYAQRTLENEDDVVDESRATVFLTIEDAVKSAMENNISVKDAEFALKNLETRKKYSWNSVSPTLNLAGNFVDDFENESVRLGFTGTVGLGLSTNLYTQIQGAKLNYEQGLITYEQSRRQIELGVRKAFYNLLYQQENLKLQKQSLETSFTQYKDNQEKYRNGQISALDVKTSQVNYQQKKPTVEQAEIMLENSFATFKQNLGIAQDVEINLRGSLDDVLKIKEIRFESLPKADVPAPSVRSAEKNVEIAKNTLLSNRFSAYGPTLSASYSYGKEKQSNADDFTTTNRLSFGVTIPLDGYLPWSSQAVVVSTQKNTLQSAENALEDAKTTVQVQTETYLRNINQAISQIESLKSNLELAEETYTMTLTAYNYGKTDFLSLLNANNNILSAGVSLKQQAYNLISTLLDLEYELGIEFETLLKGAEDIESF